MPLEENKEYRIMYAGLAMSLGVFLVSMVWVFDNMWIGSFSWGSYGCSLIGAYYTRQYYQKIVNAGGFQGDIKQ
jgi:hypothetical protein